jgi:hypothetical protein
MGRRAQFLHLRDPESRAKAAAVLREAADCLTDGFHVTLVEDLFDIAEALSQCPETEFVIRLGTKKGRMEDQIRSGFTTFDGRSRKVHQAGVKG